MHDPNRSALITEESHALGQLKKSWVTMRFSAEDGMGPMASLEQAGDSVVAIAVQSDEGTTVIGSGVMVGPGLMISATHVFDEIKSLHCASFFLTFLPAGARAWLPIETNNSTGPGSFDPDRRRKSDLTLVSCSLHSDALADYPLMLAPIRVAMPLIGARLWGFGYRHADIEEKASLLTPVVTSGLVTACFPQGRGDRMPSSCIEVAMDSVGGMSGGPVVDDDGWLIGIISSSFEGGPTYVTLLWDAFRLTVGGAPRSAWPQDEIDLFLGRELKLVHVKGTIARSKAGNVTATLSAPEMEQLAKFSDPARVTDRRSPDNGPLQ